MAQESYPKTEPYGYIRNMHLIEDAYFDPRLQEQTKLTLALLIRFADQDGSIEWFSVKNTARKKGVSRRAIQNQIEKLITYAYIAREKRKGKGWRNKYCLLFDNLGTYRDVTQSGHTPHVTPLGHTHVTSEVTLHVTQSGHIMKTLENSETKKEKETHSRDDFIDQVKQEAANGAFQEIGAFSETTILSRAEACWEYWDAYNKFPAGNRISAFKGFLRKALETGIIKTVTSSNKGSCEEGEQTNPQPEPDNPLQSWHEQIRPIVGDAQFRAWLRPCWHDDDGHICAPSQFNADFVRKNFSDDIERILPNTEILFKPYSNSVNKTEGNRNGL